MSNMRVANQRAVGQWDHERDDDLAEGAAVLVAADSHNPYNLPEVPDDTFTGVRVTGVEHALMMHALMAGELIVPVWLPASSIVPRLWKRLMADGGCPAPVRFLTEEEDADFTANVVKPRLLGDVSAFSANRAAGAAVSPLIE